MSNETNKHYNSRMGLATLVGLLGVTVLYGGSYLMIKEGQSHIKKYVVTNKADNKLIYSALDDSDDFHVMEFGGWGPDTLFYKYANVGDTITGMDYRLDAFVVSSWFNDTDYRRIDGRQSVIQRLNGKTLKDLQAIKAHEHEIARRDSIIRTMKTRQK